MAERRQAAIERREATPDPGCLRTPGGADTQVSVRPGVGDPRVALALERTFLAWIRTGLALMGFGFVVARFGVFLREMERARGVVVPSHVGWPQVVGTVLVVLGAVVSAYSVVRLRRALDSFWRHELPLTRSTLVPTLLGTALFALGALTVWYILALH